MHKSASCTIKFIPYVLIAVSILGWEIIKRTPVFVTPTISQQALRIHGLISGSALLIFSCALFIRFCLAGKRTIQLYRFEKYLFVLLAVDLMALLIGAIRRNAIVFLIGDTYKFSVIPLAYFCTTQSLQAKDARRLFLFILILETAFTLETFGIYIVRLSMGLYERVPEHSISLLAFIFFLAALIFSSRLSPGRRNVYSILIVIIGITIILSRARTLWLQALMYPVVLLLIEKKTAIVRSLVRPTVFVLVIMIPLLLGFGAVNRNVFRELGYRISGTIGLIRAIRYFGPALSTDRRVVETRAVFDRYRETPYASGIIAGFGNGAEFYAPSAALGMGSRPGYKHHIHNGYLSLFFRMGIIGLASFLIFAFSVFRHIRTVARLPARADPDGFDLVMILIPKVIFVYFLLTLIELLTIYSFIGDIKWGVLLGILRCVIPISVRNETHRETPDSFPIDGGRLGWG